MPRSIAEPPVLSLAERDRRWTRIRGFLREHGLDGVLLAGFRAREMYESYVSDDYNEGCVVFPLEGDPTVITWAPLRVMRARYSAERGHQLWVEDYRVATSGAGVAEVMREKRLGESRLGVVGLRSQAPTEIYGAIPANFWLEFSAAPWAARRLGRIQLPDAGEERRGDGAGTLCRQGRRGGVQGDRRDHRARHRRGGGLRRGDARDAALRYRLALPHDRDELRAAYALLGAAALVDAGRGAAGVGARRDDEVDWRRFAGSRFAGFAADAR